METRILWIAAIAAGVFFPVFSALTLDRKNGGALKRLVRSWLAYGAVFGLVYLGFAFQGLIDFGNAKDPYFPIYLGWFEVVKLYFILGPGTGSVGMIWLLSLLICWVTLFGKDRRQWAIFGCRAAFLTYASYDILATIVSNSSIYALIKEIVFDLVGAILFGAFVAVLLAWIFPEAQRKRSLAAAG
jgi:hypothetical protein